MCLGDVLTPWPRMLQCADIVFLYRVYGFLNANPLVHVHFVISWFHLFSIIPDYIAKFFSFLAFDSSLGYPGEGPWSIISANIDSLPANTQVFNWPASATVVQETRVSSINLRDINAVADSHDLLFLPGCLLKPKANKNGQFHVPHGGVGTIAHRGAFPFNTQEDSTGLLSNLIESTRVQATWIQVLPKLKILVFNIYLHVNGDDYLSANDAILADIFTIAAQVGDVPVLVCGDFQQQPQCYESFQLASTNDAWIDPLMTYDEDGLPHRPATFSANGSFNNLVDHFSFIDGIIMNQSALSALVKIEPLYTYGKPHAPVRAEFHWNAVFKTGFVWIRPARFDTSGISTDSDFEALAQQHAENLWPGYQANCSHSDSDIAWKSINAYGVEILQQSGLKFKRGGPLSRGDLPDFAPKTPCPGQMHDGTAATKRSCAISKIIFRIEELRKRTNRLANNGLDQVNTSNLVQRLISSLTREKIGFLRNCLLDDSYLDSLHKQLIGLLRSIRLQEKRARISSWVSLMKKGTANKNVSKAVYSWIKSRTTVDPPNLIFDNDGNCLFNPIDAIDFVNSQWDDVFSANIRHQDPHELLKFIWPSVQDRRVDADIPRLTGLQLWKQARSRKTETSTGLDGWATEEVQLLPLSFFDALADFFRDVESKHRSLPPILCRTKQVLLNKNGKTEPLNKRLISVLPCFTVLYTGVRFQHLQYWQSLVMPSQIHGAVRGRRMTDIPTQISLDIDSAAHANYALVGIKLDKSKAFDRVVVSIAIMILLALGAPPCVLNFMSSLYENLRRHTCYGKWMSPFAVSTPNGVLQGCSLSLLAMNALSCV